MPTSKSSPTPSGSSSKPTKRVAPRDKEEQRVYTTEELDALRERRKREAALYKNPDPLAGFDLGIRVLSATIESGEIRAMVVITGQVNRPEAYAVARGVTQEIRVPATVATNEGVDD